MSDGKPVIPVLVDLPFEFRYDGATGVLTVKGDLNDQMDYEVNFSAEALLRLAYQVQELEKSHEFPPTAHQKAHRLQ